MPAPEPRYRVDHAGLEPGTHLLFCTSAWQLAVGYTDFIGFTGLVEGTVFSDPVVATPIPYYDAPGPPRRWAGTTPEALWHPLFWLPERVWRRRTAGSQVEPDPVWAVRVCLEVQAAGLYEPDRGWVDVLAGYGIDTADPDDMARVLTWLDGDPDPVLDGVDLSGSLVDDRGDWAADTATALVGDFQGRAWAVIADELLSYLDEPAVGPDLAEQTLTVAQLALGTLGPVDVPGLLAPDQFWPGIEAAAKTGNGDQLVGHVEDAAEWLTAVRQRYWPHLDVLDQLAASTTVQPDPQDSPR